MAKCVSVWRLAGPAIPNSNHLPSQTSRLGRGYTQIYLDFYKNAPNIRVYQVNPRPIFARFASTAFEFGIAVGAPNVDCL